MKKKAFLTLLAFLPLVLTSCGEELEINSIEDLTSAVSTYVDQEYETTDYEGYVYAFGEEMDLDGYIELEMDREPDPVTADQTEYTLTYRSSQYDPSRLYVYFWSYEQYTNDEMDDGEQISTANAGDTIIVEVYIPASASYTLNDVYANDDVIELLEQNSRYYFYSFTMPENNVVVTLDWEYTLQSTITHAPLQLNSTDFYYETNGSMSNACQYYSIYQRLVNTSGSTTELQTHIGDDNSITFYVTNSDNTIPIYIYSENLSWNARWNITLEYDSNGYLISESYASINYKEGNTESCYLYCEYIYA